MVKTLITLFVGTVCLSLVCMDESQGGQAIRTFQGFPPSQFEDPRLKGYREAFRAVGVGKLITHYENNLAYVDEAPRLYLNAIKFNSENAQVVLDLTPLEKAIVGLQGRDLRIQTNKSDLKTGLVTLLLCGCSFTLGIKFATILMKKNLL
jgi:hypothetical protein